MNSSLSRQVIFYFDSAACDRNNLGILEILRCFRSESPGSRETPFIGRRSAALRSSSALFIKSCSVMRGNAAERGTLRSIGDLRVGL